MKSLREKFVSSLICYVSGLSLICMMALLLLTLLPHNDIRETLSIEGFFLKEIHQAYDHLGIRGLYSWPES